MTVARPPRALALVRPDDAPTHTTIERADDGAVNITKIVYQAARDELRPLAYWLEAFGLPEAPVRRWIDRGILPAIRAKRGGTLVRLSDLLGVVDKLAPKATDEPKPADSYQALVAHAKRGAR